MVGVGVVMSSLGRLLHGLADAALPQTCVVCGEAVAGGALPMCEACAQELSAIRRTPYCRRCGRTMRPESVHERGCARCRTEHIWNVAGLARVGAYEPPLRAMGIGLKYKGRERNADYLGELLAAELNRLGWPAELDALVPVPMSRLRRWQRPCDHAEVLATAVARRLGLPVWRAVMRVRHTPSQTGVTSRAARFANVAGCFAVRRGARLEGRRVCIVDNLLATGATICEVAKVLRRAGAREIRAAVVSRTVLAGDAQADSEAIEEAFPVV